MKSRLYPAGWSGARRVRSAHGFPISRAASPAESHRKKPSRKPRRRLPKRLMDGPSVGRPLPEPTPVEQIALPKGCDYVAYFIVGVDPPDPSERVNIYLPRSLIARIDKRAAELGMSRSSFFGLAATTVLSNFPGYVRPDLSAPRSKVQKSGRLRTKK